MLRAGGDKENPGYCRLLQFAREGDRVIFLEEKLEHFDRAQKNGVLKEQDVIAIYRGPDHNTGLEPANGWVALRPQGAFWRANGNHSTIYLPDAVRRRPDIGVVQDYGPGEIRISGPFRGSRKPVEEILTTTREELIGAKVHFHPDALVVEVTGDSDYVETYLVQARDLLAIETE